MPISFEIVSTNESARAGVLHTDHGAVATPVFMPVGTQGAVKAATPHMLGEIGAGIILANTYHLVMRPGADVVSALGGLHRFMSWKGAILTDSGGFQVMSLADLRKVTSDGIAFRSHVDGALHLFTPESAIQDQATLGADIIMALDYCAAYPCERTEAERAVALTTQWAGRAAAVYGRRFEMEGYERVIFGIVQGSTHLDLRDRSRREILDLDFPGYAIGGLSVGEEQAATWEIVESVAGGLPADRPRYLMGMGTPVDLVNGVARGIDMFDCVMPTRNARNGTVFTRKGKLVLKNSVHTRAAGPLEEGCLCYTCRNFSRGYLRHLFNASEILGPVLATYHNLYYYCDLMREIRAAIELGEFCAWRVRFIEQYNSGAADDA